MNHCCDAFAYYAAKAGCEGISIDAREVDGCKPLFLIAFRSFDESRLSEVEELFRGTTDATHLKLGREVSIRFCPWCGKRLK